MKRVLRYSILIIIFSAFVFGCETERIIFKGPYHVRFTEPAGAEKESYSKPVKIEVHMAGPAPDKDVIVFYTISGSAREGIDYTILGTRGSVKIEKGKYFGYIEVQLINNSNNILRSQDIIFTLQNVDDNALQVGQGTGGIGRQFTLTIIDDCFLGGIFAGSRGAFSIPVRNITITSQDCENYRLSNWNINYILYPFDLGLNFIDNFDNTITIPKQDEIIPLEGIGTVDLTKREIEIILTIFWSEIFDDEEDVELRIKLIPD